MSNGDHAAHHHIVGKAEQRAQVGVVLQHAGEKASAKATAATCELKAPCGRKDGAVDARIDIRPVRATRVPGLGLEARDHQHRDLIEVIPQALRGEERWRVLVEIWVVVAKLRKVLGGRLRVQLTNASTNGRVIDHQETPQLGTAAVGCLQRNREALVDQIPSNRRIEIQAPPH